MEVALLLSMGTVNIGFGQKIVVTCEVSNDFGSDTEETLINKCGK